MSKIYESEADLPWTYARNPDMIATLRDRDRLRAEVERLRAENARLLHTCHLSSGSTVVKCGRCAACLTNELNLRESALNSERLAHSATCRELERLRAEREDLLHGSGFCQDPACAGHCGYGHLDGCAAIREYLSDNGAEKFKGVEGRTEAYRRLKAERESLRERVLAFCRNKMHKGWHDELAAILEETR